MKKTETIQHEQRKLIDKLLNPIKTEFRLKDLIQIMVGASILAIPVGFTEETWNLGLTLPLTNIITLGGLSLLFISLFAYYTYYRKTGLKNNWNHFIKRVLSTYFVSFIIVSILLGIIQKAPWTTDWMLALKRATIVTFPSTMSAAVADTIK